MEAARNDYGGWTALMDAARNDNLEIFRELIKAGANREADSPRLRSRSSLDLQNEEGDTALSLSRNDEIRNLINKSTQAKLRGSVNRCQSIRENLKQLKNLQSS